MQIHELPTFTGTPGASDYFAVDNGSITAKVAGSDMVNPDAMTVAEATAGTSTAERVVTPKVVHDYVTGEVSDGIDNITTSATETKWAGITGGDGSINDALNYTADNEIAKTFTPSFNPTVGSVVDTSVIQYGRVCSLNITITKTTATAAGSNMFSGTMSDAPLPVNAARFIGYAGSAIVVAHLNTNGSISGRVVGAQISANANVGVAGTYITAE